MILIAVEAVPAGSKPPVAISARIFTGERHGFGAAAPLSTRTSSLSQGRAGGPVKSSAKLVRHTGVMIDLVRKTAILILRLNYYSVLHTLVSLLVSCYVCLPGETWLPSILLEVY